MGCPRANRGNGTRQGGAQGREEGLQDRPQAGTSVGLVRDHGDCGPAPSSSAASPCRRPGAAALPADVPPDDRARQHSHRHGRRLRSHGPASDALGAAGAARRNRTDAVAATYGQARSATRRAASVPARPQRDEASAAVLHGRDRHPGRDVRAVPERPVRQCGRPRPAQEQPDAARGRDRQTGVPQRLCRTHRRGRLRGPHPTRLDARQEGRPDPALPGGIQAAPRQAPRRHRSSVHRLLGLVRGRAHLRHAQVRPHGPERPGPRHQDSRDEPVQGRLSDAHRRRRQHGRADGPDVQPDAHPAEDGALRRCRHVHPALHVLRLHRAAAEGDRDERPVDRRFVRRDRVGLPVRASRRLS